MNAPARAAHLATFVVAFAALMLQFVLVWQGHVVLDETNPPARTERVVRFFCYFTILSNGLVAATALMASRGQTAGRAFRVLRLNAVTGIAVTAVVHWFLLRPLLDLDGADFWADKLLHVVVPLLALATWVAYGPRGHVSRDDLALSAIFPAGYLALTLVHGEATDWYPYPFIDVTELGYARVLANAAGVVLLLTLLSLAVWRLDERRSTRDGRR